MKQNASKVFFINEFKILLLLIFVMFSISFIGQYSAFCGELSPMVIKHCIRMLLSLILMIVIYSFDFRFWKSFAYVFYAISLCALLLVEVIGVVKLGAKRWINLDLFMFQPSELMKLALILALAKYYSALYTIDIKNIRNHVVPILMTLVPTFLILKQPDFGTASMLFCVGAGIIFLSGFPIKYFITICVSAICSCPLLWFCLHDYQKNRILTFMDPDRDPLGNGYHVLQSKIAVGSGGIFGKGFLLGTQSKLNFLPEKNTDFIFTTLSEEVGFIGSVIIIGMFLLMTFYYFWAGSESKSPFAKLVCCGIAMLFFLHAFINIAMVIGLVPVVGIPLPFLSYGGSSMIMFMMGSGIVMGSLSHKKYY